jgi:hypothetical protein
MFDAEARALGELRGEADRLAQSMADTGVAVLPRSVSRVLVDAMRGEVAALLPQGHCVDFLMPQSGHTPRKMTVVGGNATRDAPRLRSIYGNSALHDILSRIFKAKVAACPVPCEDLIITRLSDRGDTHGWHLDDFPAALIFVLSAPPPSRGGQLEYVDLHGVPRERTLSAGDAYLMRSDRVRHRVAPIDGTHDRTIVNMTYGFEGVLVEPNGSAESLCVA